MLSRANANRVAKVLTHATAFNRTNSISFRIAQVQLSFLVELLRMKLSGASNNEVAKVLTHAPAFDRKCIVVCQLEICRLHKSKYWKLPSFKTVFGGRGSSNRCCLAPVLTKLRNLTHATAFDRTCIVVMSTSNCCCSPGYCTLTATSCPVDLRTARWTWASDAAAMGV